ncbi:carbohydrate kinase family protein [Candidatus Uhrbacteria bacterium]|nr:carbohydrate kinase family protein [Candidatus Uhrbacteria bacterium]
MKEKKTYTYDIICIGDAGMDAYAGIHDASLLCNINKTDCWFCLNFAEKIPIEELHFTLGGNGCNVAVGSARLGLKSAFYTIVGTDDTGKKILHTLEYEGVSLEYITSKKNSRSNYAVALMYKKERTILSYHIPRVYALPKFSQTKWIYLTSLGNGFERVYARLLSQLKQSDIQLAFNPGTRQLRAGRKVLDPILKKTEILFLNKEEGGMVLGKESGYPIEKIAKELHALGPHMVVVTDASHGACGFDGKKIFIQKVLPAKVKEKTGAGDAFATGTVAALIQGKHLGEALIWGAANSASVVEHLGPQAGLLTKQKLLGRIKKSKN